MDKPLLTVDRQMGLVIVTPEGKVSFVRRMSAKLTDRNRRRCSSESHTTLRGIRAWFIVSCRYPV